MSDKLRLCAWRAAITSALSVAGTLLPIDQISAQEANPAENSQPTGSSASLPEVSVIQPKAAAKAKPQKKIAPPAPIIENAASSAPPKSEIGEEDTNGASANGPTPVPVGTRSGSLGVPNTAEAIAEINRTPGGVEVVQDTEFKEGRAQTVRDVLAAVPGVITQPRWGIDGRLSIRGSGLTRNYGNRGISMYMDGIAINSSDGLFDLFEIDPTAYRYVEVYKGANALRFGSNSLGGAINFVTPTGYDADLFGARVDIGSFGFYKASVNSGGVSGPVDYFIAASALSEDGYRQHSDGDMERVSGNLGYRLSADAETRFYINANTWRQHLPGEVTKSEALASPRQANADFITGDQQRNIDSLRLANKTMLRFDETTVEFGVSTHQRHVDHPIFQYLDYYVHDYGAFARAIDDRAIGGFRNRFIIGANLLSGSMDNEIYQNLGGRKGAKVASTEDTSQNVSAYLENSFFVHPTFALVTGTQFLHASRHRRDRFFNDDAFSFGPDATDDDSWRRDFNLWSPKVGFVWDAAPAVQVFGNISRSAEVPTYDITGYSTLPGATVNAQTATTYEIGTRGGSTDAKWDISIYHAELSNELQCLTTSPFAPCTLSNADSTVHQGIEAGLNLAVLQSVFGQGDRVWMNLTYTYNDFHFADDAVWGNNRLPGVGPHNVRAELLYRSLDGFYAGPNVEWMPSAYYADNANTLTVDPFALLNFKVGVEQEKGWSAYVEGRNLTDERYISTTITAGTASATSALFNPGTGRAIYAGVQTKW